jgi:hypothetical protein
MSFNVHKLGQLLIERLKLLSISDIDGWLEVVRAKVYPYREVFVAKNCLLVAEDGICELGVEILFEDSVAIVRQVDVDSFAGWC